MFNNFARKNRPHQKMIRLN